VGVHAISAEAYDAAGNVGVSSNVSVNVRTTVTVTSPVSGSTVSGNVVEFTATSDDPLLGLAELAIDETTVDSVYLAEPSTSMTFEHV